MAYSTTPTLAEMTDADLEQLIIDAQAVVDARKVDTAACDATRDALLAFVSANSDTIGANGLKAIIESDYLDIDGVWARLSFDLQNLTKPQRVIAIGAMSQAVNKYGAQWIIEGQQIRQSKDEIIAHLNLLIELDQAAT